MFKNETIVKLVLVGLALSAISAKADDSLIRNLNNNSNNEWINKKLESLGCDAPTPANQEKCTYWEKKMSNVSDGCSNSAKDFSDAGKEFADACGKAHLQSNLNDTSSGYACSKPLIACMKAQQAGKNLKDYASCPPLAAQDLKDLKDEADKARKHIDELQDKLPDLEQKKTDAGNQLADKLSEISDQAKEAQSKYSEAIAQAAKDRSQAVQNLRDKVNQYNDEINRSQQQIVENAQGLYKAQTEYQASVHQINATCFTQAQQQATAERARYAAAGNPFPSMTAMFKKQGMSDQKWWDSRAQYYYNRCRAMKITTDQLADVASTRNAAVQSVNDAAAVIRNQMSQTQAKIRQTGLQTGCFGNAAGPGGETEMCGILRDLNQANQRAQQELVNSKASSDNSVKRAAAQASSASNSADQQIQAIHQKITSEQNRLNSLTSDLEQRSKYASSSDSEAVNKLGEAEGKMQGMAIMAQKRLACCGSHYEKDCDLAYDFLDRLKIKMDTAGAAKVLDMRRGSTPASSSTSTSGTNIDGTIGNPGTGSH